MLSLVNIRSGRGVFAFKLGCAPRGSNGLPLSASPSCLTAFWAKLYEGRRLESGRGVTDGAVDLFLDLSSSRPHSTLPALMDIQTWSTFSSFFQGLWGPHPCSEQAPAPGRQVWKVTGSLCTHEGLISLEITSPRFHPLLFVQVFLGITLGVKVFHDLLCPNQEWQSLTHLISG